MEPPEIQNIMKTYYKQLYSIKLENLEKQQISRNMLSPTLNEEEAESLNRSIKEMKVKIVFKNLLKNKSPGSP